MALSDTVLHFSGHQHLRHRLVLSILSGKPVRIDKIRSDDKDPGLRGAQFSLSAITYVSDAGSSGRLWSQPFEASRKSNKWNYHRNFSYWYVLYYWCEGVVLAWYFPGTAILLKPGVITGGPVVHDCPLSRSIGYFLETVVMLAPFAKKPLQLTLRGITTDDQDLSVSLFSAIQFRALIDMLGWPHSNCDFASLAIIRSIWWTGITRKSSTFSYRLPISNLSSDQKKR